MPTIKEKKKESFLNKILGQIEKAGNKLPDPVTIFVVLCLAILVLSSVLSYFGVSKIHPMTNEPVAVVNLLSRESLQNIISNMVGTFQGFPPLGLVLVVMFGAGVAEKTGLLTALMISSITKVPSKLVTVVLILTGIIANAFGDAGVVVLPPLAGIIYLGIGRHPLVGIFTAYAAVAAGFAANLIINMSDILAAGFTIPAAQVIDPAYQGTPAMNYYFLVVSTIVLTGVGVWVSERIIAPRFPEYKGDVTGEKITSLSTEEIRGLKMAGLGFLVIAIIFVGLSLGKMPFLGDPETGSLLALGSILMKGMVPLITIMFLIPGIIYGVAVGTVKSDKDVVSMIGASMSEMGPYIVLAFAASQFLALFNQSNLGIVLAVSGAEALESAGVKGVGLIMGLVILSGFINIFIGSASAKWAMLAPIFVPMFLLLGYDPAVTQMAYRIGDSITNPISPLFPYFPILLAFAKKYDKKLGMGTVIANMLPFSMAFAVVWMILLVIFVVFNISLGPGAGIFYSL